MDRNQRQKLKREIRRAYKIHTAIDDLPKRYRDVVLDGIIHGRNWHEMQEKYHYSERQIRNNLNEALEELNRRISPPEKIHPKI